MNDKEFQNGIVVATYFMCLMPIFMAVWMLWVMPHALPYLHNFGLFLAKLVVYYF